jgi:hypothetical protein
MPVEMVTRKIRTDDADRGIIVYGCIRPGENRKTIPSPKRTWAITLRFPLEFGECFYFATYIIIPWG